MENFWYIFGTFGLVVAGVICVIAVVWLTCFAVRILTKTFGTTVANFNAVEKENIEKKFKAKKERVAKRREQTIAHKNEILELKMLKNEQIHKIKMQKLEQNLNEKVQAIADKNEIKVDIDVKYANDISKASDLEEAKEINSEDNKLDNND